MTSFFIEPSYIFSGKISSYIQRYFVFRIYRPRFCPENRYPVLVGSEIQDHCIDPRGHRHNCIEDMEGFDPGSAIPCPVRRHGHLQVYQTQGGRSRNTALPVAGLARTPPRRIRSCQSVQRATARATITGPKKISILDGVLYYLFSFVSQNYYLFIFIMSNKKTMIIKLSYFSVYSLLRFIDKKT